MPPFLRRKLVLLEARRALSRGAPEQAVSLLRDPVLAGSAAAEGLRKKAMERLYQVVRERAKEGRERSFFRLLGVVAEEDPERAASWRRELVEGSSEVGGTFSIQPSGAATSVQPPDPTERPSALEALLHSLRETHPESSAAPSGEPKSGAFAPHPVSLRFHLAVDDGGEFLVVSGSEITLGHARTARADIPFLADLESLHASISRRESFHAGAHWVLTPHVQPAWVDGVEVGIAASRELSDGQVVRLSPRVEFIFRLPEEASSSVLLELLHGAEADGATRVILMVPGPGGRVRIGPRLRRHVPVPDLEHEVVLTLDGDEMNVRCVGGVRIEGLARNSESASTNKSVPCPPPARIDLTVNARPSRRPPFALTVRPLTNGP